MTKPAVNNMASSFEPNAYPYVPSDLFTGLHAIVDLHNSLLDSIITGEKNRERYVELDYKLEVQIKLMSELPQGTTTTTVYNRNATAVIQIMAWGRANLVHLTLAYSKQLLILF